MFEQENPCKATAKRSNMETHNETLEKGQSQRSTTQTERHRGRLEALTQSLAEDLAIVFCHELFEYSYMKSLLSFWSNIA